MEQPPLRVPISVASQRGVSWLNDVAADRRVVLTRFGSPGAVIESAERFDEVAARLDDARRAVVEAAADLARGQYEPRSFDQLCERLGVDPQRVRDRAASRSASLA